MLRSVRTPAGVSRELVNVPTTIAPDLRLSCTRVRGRSPKQMQGPAMHTLGAPRTPQATRITERNGRIRQLLLLRTPFMFGVRSSLIETHVAAKRPRTLNVNGTSSLAVRCRGGHV